MKTYQLKVEMKKMKPPVWKRCLIPVGITFAQLSIILENLMETIVADDYEFEFFQKKIHLREWHEGENVTRYMFDFMSASETYIDRLLEHGEWFTFRPGKGTGYRVTVEKCITNMECNYPVILKQTDNLNVHAWKEIAEKNKELQMALTVHYGKPDYRGFSELKKEMGKGVPGLRGSHKAVSRSQHNEKSPETMLRELSEQLIKPYIERAMQQSADKMQNKETGEFVYDPDIEAEILASIGDDMKREIPLKLFGNTPVKTKTRKPTVVGYLMSYGKEDLMDMAKELRLRRYKNLKKAELAEKIKNEILDPEVMKKRMLFLSDSEMAVFEEIIREGISYRPEEKNLEALYSLDYIACYLDGYAEVPEEVVTVYEKINTPEYQHMRSQISWMCACLNIVELFYASAPVRIVHQIFRKRSDCKVSKKEFLNIFEQIPEEKNPCVICGDKIICKITLKNNVYLNIERYQAGKEFYIPSEEEVWDYYQNGYPSTDLHYQRLETFFRKELQLESDTINYLLVEIWRGISMGAAFSDIMDLVNEEQIVFPTEHTVKQFTNIMMEVNNNTRMLDHRGHTPNEIIARSPRSLGKKPTIVPMSTLAANMLKEAQPELDARGFTVDFDSNAQEIPAILFPDGPGGETVVAGRKIYPNDPCPCGSGKKYKKCCGRNK